jgi:hypothetical protein
LAKKDWVVAIASRRNAEIRQVILVVDSTVIEYAAQIGDSQLIDLDRQAIHEVVKVGSVDGPGPLLVVDQTVSRAHSHAD